MAVLLYFSLFHSLLCYGILAWGASGSTNINRIVRLQDRMVKLIPASDDRSNYEAFNILKFDKLYKYFSAIKLFRAHHLGFHQYFVNNILSLVPAHSYPTRNSQSNYLNIPRYRLSKCHQSFFYNSCSNWNDIPSNIRESRTKDEFRKLYKQFLLNNS